LTWWVRRSLTESKNDRSWFWIASFWRKLLMIVARWLKKCVFEIITSLKWATSASKACVCRSWLHGYIKLSIACMSQSSTDVKSRQWTFIYLSIYYALLNVKYNVFIKNEIIIVIYVNDLIFTKLNLVTIF
jgi:hypothetical protein